MSGFEKNSFQDFASDYFQYIIGSIESQTKTLLVSKLKFEDQYGSLVLYF